LTTVLNEQLFVQPVVKPGCTTGLTTGLTTGCIVYTNIYLVVNRFDNRFDNRLYRVNGASISCCLRVGPRCDVACAVISSSNGCLLPWATGMRYLLFFLQIQRPLNARYMQPSGSFTERVIASLAKLDELLLRKWYCTW